MDYYFSGHLKSQRILKYMNCILFDKILYNNCFVLPLVLTFSPFLYLQYVYFHCVY